ncbi:hypothetical protein LCGC14_1078720 [marine sediment metagenome]|uniref:Uncharacterized protein n=1 Tax=marine sediment metagenome TaxID=412755 RepID=A0A0F9QLU3_9ZZZZ
MVAIILKCAKCGKELTHHININFEVLIEPCDHVRGEKEIEEIRKG